MPLKAWTTRSYTSFDSFYYYNTTNRNFVRITLGLGKTWPSCHPGVFARLNRFVGFVDDTSIFDFKDFSRWFVNTKNEIVYNTHNGFMVLPNNPAEGKKIIDFSLDADALHPTVIHYGNAVTKGPYRLPENSKGEKVTEIILETIAESQIGEYARISFCQSKNSEKELADNIFNLYHHINLMLQN